MANYPRCVKSLNVDSAALFGAYLHYLGTCGDAGEREQLTDLYMINHRPYVFTAGQPLSEIVQHQDVIDVLAHRVATCSAGSMCVGRQHTVGGQGKIPGCLEMKKVASM